mgnify:CR=1 FL=1
MSSIFQFHQQENHVLVFVKGNNIQEEDLDVQIQRRRLTVVLHKNTIVEGLLHGQVDVGNSRVKIHPDFVEIKLRKAKNGSNEVEVWPQLLLGVPDMMTSLQRAQALHPAHAPPVAGNKRRTSYVISPEHSPHKAKTVVGQGASSLNASLNASLSNFVHKVFTHTNLDDSESSQHRQEQHEVSASDDEPQLEESLVLEERREEVVEFAV